MPACNVAAQQAKGESTMTLRMALAVMFLASGTALAAGSGDLDYVLAASLPPGIADAFAGKPRYVFEARLNPFYLHGDFDGDGWRDTVILLKEKATGKSGYGFVLKRGRVAVVGAGTPIDGMGDDFSALDAWHVEPRGKVLQGASDESPPKIKGDALMVIKTESASGLIYWNGKRFRWYQQGD